jgi:hypothetical protein
MLRSSGSSSPLSSNSTTPLHSRLQPLFGVCDDDDGGRTVGAGGRGAARLVLAGGAHGVLAGEVAAGTCFSIASSAQPGNETITYAGTCFWYLGMRALARLVGPRNAGFIATWPSALTPEVQRQKSAR